MKQLRPQANNPDLTHQTHAEEQRPMNRTPSNKDPIHAALLVLLDLNPGAVLAAI